jgi:hypothetical protein
VLVEDPQGQEVCVRPAAEHLYGLGGSGPRMTRWRALAGVSAGGRSSGKTAELWEISPYLVREVWLDV